MRPLYRFAPMWLLYRVNRYRVRHLCGGCGYDARVGLHGMSEYGGCV